MAKRFTDTEKYKKPFIRSLKGAYKLLWDYLYTSCDNAGIWIVDFEVAQIYLGKDMPVNREDALRYFNDGQLRIHEFAGGTKWFLTSYIEFQHGSLSETNPAHKKIIPILKSLDFIDDSLNLKSTFKAPYEGTKVEVIAIEMVDVGAKEKKSEKAKNATEAHQGAFEVITYLNTQSGKNFNATRLQSTKFVISRLDEGYTVADLKKIIDCKVEKWGNDDKMRPFLRPETLFAPSKIDGYLQDANDPKITKPQNGHDPRYSATFVKDKA